MLTNVVIGQQCCHIVTILSHCCMDDTLVNVAVLKNSQMSVRVGIVCYNITLSVSIVYIFLF
jgi:hypothetical protein